MTTCCRWCLRRSSPCLEEKYRAKTVKQQISSLSSRVIKSSVLKLKTLETLAAQAQHFPQQRDNLPQKNINKSSHTKNTLKEMAVTFLNKALHKPPQKQEVRHGVS